MSTLEYECPTCHTLKIVTGAAGIVVMLPAQETLCLNQDPLIRELVKALSGSQKLLQKNMQYMQMNESGGPDCADTIQSIIDIGTLLDVAKEAGFCE